MIFRKKDKQRPVAKPPAPQNVDFNLASRGVTTFAFGLTPTYLQVAKHDNKPTEDQIYDLVRQIGTHHVEIIYFREALEAYSSLCKKVEHIFQTLKSQVDIAAANGGNPSDVVVWEEKNFRMARKRVIEHLLRVEEELMRFVDEGGLPRYNGFG